MFFGQLLLICGTLTQDVLDQDVTCPGRLRVASSIHSINLELALFAFLQVRNCDFSRCVQLVGRINPPPIRRALLMHFNDVPFEGATAIFVWRAPCESDAVLGLVFNQRGSR